MVNPKFGMIKPLALIVLAGLAMVFGFRACRKVRRPEIMHPAKFETPKIKAQKPCRKCNVIRKTKYKPKAKIKEEENNTWWWDNQKINLEGKT